MVKELTPLPDQLLQSLSAKENEIENPYKGLDNNFALRQ